MSGAVQWCLRGDKRGVALVEFALLAPVMLMLICGTIETGHMIFARMVLEGSITEAARKATASLETTESDRDAVMRSSIKQAMSNFPLARGRSITITTAVYHDFSSVTPETFTDINRNGRYDLGETFVDRNRNGRWDNASPIADRTLGGPGDVVSYTVTFPKAVLFGWLSEVFRFRNGIVPLNATTVVRNEAVVRKT